MEISRIPLKKKPAKGSGNRTTFICIYTVKSEMKLDKVSV